MPILYRKEVNTEDKIRVYFFLDGVLFDPYLVKYTLLTPECVEINHQVEKDALQFSTGHFYADYTVAADAAIGEYKIVWIFQKDVDSALNSQSDYFNVVIDLSEGCIASHPSSADSSSTHKQSGTCDCSQDALQRDHFGRIINL